MRGLTFSAANYPVPGAVHAPYPYEDINGTSCKNRSDGKVGNFVSQGKLTPNEKNSSDCSDCADLGEDKRAKGEIASSRLQFRGKSAFWLVRKAELSNNGRARSYSYPVDKKSRFDEHK
jgi:hypothetical protein